MHFGPSNLRYDYHTYNCKLVVVREQKDLEVWISQDLKASQQCLQAQARARERTRTHTHTHARARAFNGALSGPIWILLKQQTVSASGISWAICKSAPCSRQTTTPAPHHSVFYRPDALPAAQPTVSKH